jgi:carboxymethylenebutenolidase
MLIVAACLAVFQARAQTEEANTWARNQLGKSPRHGEWVKIKQGNRQVEAFITYPEIKDKAVAVVVIHEIFGLTDWARCVTDELAEAGYIAIAPDLLSGMGPNGGGSAELGDNARRTISSLPPDQITADLNAVADYAAKLPACNGKIAVAGFCWGGGESFRFATNNKDLRAAFVFYGTGPSAASLSRINCPVYGFYGGNDARVTATVPATTEAMKTAGKTYEPVTYDGAGHGFMRAGDLPNGTPDNKKAHDEAWKSVKEILKKL